MEKVFVFDHPLIQHKLTMLRKEETDTKEFRELVAEIAMLMGYEVTRNMPLEEIEIKTPIAVAKSKVLAGKNIGIVPILRAGLGMVEGILKILPMAKVGHIGLYRDPETLKPVEYYCKLPVNADERDVVVLDPMLATGGSATEAISIIKNKGVKNIKLMCILASKQGIKSMREAHPDVEIYCAAVDEALNENGYIVPGLGDAGDRLFGTK